MNRSFMVRSLCTVIPADICNGLELVCDLGTAVVVMLLSRTLSELKPENKPK